MRSSLFARRAFSLVEVMVVLTGMAVLSAMDVPSYQRAIEQSHADIAAANLRSIWSAQRLYWIESHTFAPDLKLLQSMGLVDTGNVLGTTGYAYAVTSADQNRFTAVAVRTGSSRYSGEYSIDETGTISGAVKAQGQPDLIPGFE